MHYRSEAYNQSQALKNVKCKISKVLVGASLNVDTLFNY